MGNPVVDSSKKIIIKGGANIFDGQNRRIPTAEETLISQDELEQLRNDVTFAAYERDGFIVVTSLKEKSSEVVESMEAKDNSAQRTTTDLPDGTKVINRKGEVVIEVAESNQERDSVTLSTKKSASKKAYIKGKK